MIHVKRVDDFLNNKREIKENINKLDFEPIKWGVKNYDDEADEDGGIPVTVSACDDSGRTEAESYWKIYPLKKYNDSWDVKAICTESDDRRYEPGDEVEFELNQGPYAWELEGDLHDALEDMGY